MAKLIYILLILLSYHVSYACNDIVIIPEKSNWRFLDDGSDQGTNWVDSTFNDSSWSSGIGQLGYGDSDEATVVSYGNNSNNKHTTTYFRTSFVVSDSSDFSSLRITLLYDDGAIIYINGTEVVRENLPSGNVDYQTICNRS